MYCAQASLCHIRSGLERYHIVPGASGNGDEKNLESGLRCHSTLTEVTITPFFIIISSPIRPPASTEAAAYACPSLSTYVRGPRAPDKDVSYLERLIQEGTQPGATRVGLSRMRCAARWPAPCSRLKARAVPAGHPGGPSHSTERLFRWFILVKNARRTLKTCRADQGRTGLVLTHLPLATPPLCLPRFTGDAAHQLPQFLKADNSARKSAGADPDNRHRGRTLGVV